MIYFSFFSYLFAIVAIARAQLSFSPAVPYCDGDTVTFTCILEPAGNPFIITRASIRFVNDSNTCYTRAAINDNNTPPINSTRYTHQNNVPGIVSPMASAVLEINLFQVVDASIPFSCCVETNDTVFISNSIYPTPLAAPPSAPTSLSTSSAYGSDSTCTGTISLTWLAVASDRPVTSYAVLLNGTVDGTTCNTTYTTGSLNLLEYYNFTVLATSCAGKSMASVLFTSLPAPPSNATINISTTYGSDINCPITLYWPEVISDRNVTSYEVLLNGTTNITTLSSKPGINIFTTSNISLVTNNGSYTVRAINCAGSSISNERDIIPPNIPSTSNITNITGNNSYIIFSIASTGIIAIYYIHINGMTDKITPDNSGNVYNYSGNLIPMYGNYNFSISAGNCIGNSSNSNSLFIIGKVKPTATTTAPTTPAATSSGTDNSTNPMASTSFPTFTSSNAITPITATTTTTPITATTTPILTTISPPPTTTLNDSSAGSQIIIFIVVPSGGILLLAIILVIVIIILIICFYKRRTNRKTSTIRTTFLRDSESNIPSQHESSIQMSTVASPPIYSMVDYDAKRSDQKMKSETNKKNEPQLNYADLNFMQKETNFNNSGQNPSESTQYAMVHRSNANEPPTHYTDILKEENPYFTQFS